MAGVIIRRRAGMREAMGAAPDSGEERSTRVPMFGLLGANAVSQIGNMMLVVAGPWFVLETTGSAAKTGVVGAALAVGAVIPPVLGGPLIDWLGFKRGSFLPDLAAAASVGAIPLLHFTGALQFWHLVLLVFLLASLNALGDTARYALVPDLSRRAAWSPETANGADRAMVRLGAFLGPLLGGALIALIGAPNVLLIDCVTFLTSATLIAVFVPRGANKPVSKLAAPRHSYVAELVSGLRYVRRTRLTLSMVLVATGANFLNVPLLAVILPVYAKDVFGSAASLGIMVGSYGAGAFVGTLLFGAVGHRLPRRLTFISCWVVSPLIVYGVLSATPPLAVVALGGCIAGVVAGPINPLYSMTIQDHTPPEMLGRVFGALTALAQAAVPVGAVAAGLAVQRFGLVATLTGMGAMVLAMTLTMFLNRGLAQMDAGPGSVEVVA